MDEIFSCAFNSAGNTIITGSKDNTCRIWNSKSMLECAADGIAVGCENGKMLHPQAPCLLEDEEKAENHKIDDGEFDDQKEADVLCAAEKGNLDEEIGDEEADVNGVNDEGNTALILTTICKSDSAAECAKINVESNADPELGALRKDAPRDGDARSPD